MAEARRSAHSAETLFKKRLCIIRTASVFICSSACRDSISFVIPVFGVPKMSSVRRSAKTQTGLSFVRGIHKRTRLLCVLSAHLKRFVRRRVSGRSNEKRIEMNECERGKGPNLQMQPLHYANVTFNCAHYAQKLSFPFGNSFALCTKSQRRERRGKKTQQRDVHVSNAHQRKEFYARIHFFISSPPRSSAALP